MPKLDDATKQMLLNIQARRQHIDEWQRYSRHNVQYRLIGCPVSEVNADCPAKAPEKAQEGWKRMEQGICIALTVWAIACVFLMLFSLILAGCGY